jgi:hypothetical protein
VLFDPLKQGMLSAPAFVKTQSKTEILGEEEHESALRSTALFAKMQNRISSPAPRPYRDPRVNELL